MASPLRVLRSDMASDVRAPPYNADNQDRDHRDTGWSTMTASLAHSNNSSRLSFLRPSNLNEVDDMPSSAEGARQPQQHPIHPRPRHVYLDHAQSSDAELTRQGDRLAPNSMINGQPLDMSLPAITRASDTTTIITATALARITGAQQAVPSLCVEQRHDHTPLHQPPWSIPMHAWPETLSLDTDDQQSMLPYARSSISSSTSSPSLVESHTEPSESKMKPHNHLHDLSLSQKNVLADDSARRFSQISGMTSANPVTPEDTLGRQQCNSHTDTQSMVVNGAIVHPQQWPCLVTRSELNVSNRVPLTQQHFVHQPQYVQRYPVVPQVPFTRPATRHVTPPVNLRETTAVRLGSCTQSTKYTNTVPHSAAQAPLQSSSRCCTSTLRPLAPSQLSGYMAEMIVYLWYSQPQPVSFKSASQQEMHVRFPKPSASFKRWCHDVLQTTQVSQSLVVLALFFIWKLLRNHHIPAPPGSEYVLSTIGLMLANKILDDHTYTNKTWSEVAGLPLKILSQSEREFLQGLDYNLYIDKMNYERWEELLKAPTAEVLTRNTRPCARKRARFTNKNWALAPSAPSSPSQQPATTFITAPISAAPIARPRKQMSRPAINKPHTVPHGLQLPELLAPAAIPRSVASSPGMLFCPAVSTSLNRATKRKATDEQPPEQEIYDQTLLPGQIQHTFCSYPAAHTSTSAGQSHNIHFSTLASTCIQPNVQIQAPLHFYELAAGQPGGGRLTSQPITSGSAIPQYIYPMASHNTRGTGYTELITNTPLRNPAIPNQILAHSAQPQSLVSHHALGQHDQGRKALSLSPLNYRELIAQDDARSAGSNACPLSAPKDGSAVIHTEPRLIMPMPIRACTQQTSGPMGAQNTMWPHQLMQHDTMMFADTEMYPVFATAQMGSHFANNGPPAIWNWASLNHHLHS